MAIVFHLIKSGELWLNVNILCAFITMALKASMAKLYSENQKQKEESIDAAKTPKHVQQT